LKAANEQLKAANAQVSTLTAVVSELTERIKNLEQLLTEKGIAIDKLGRINKALATMADGKKNERQESKGDTKTMTQEEYNAMLEERRKKRKARKNNGARRDRHMELDMETVYVDVDPEMPEGVDVSTLRLLGAREVIRYSISQPKVTKTVFRVRSLTDGKTVYQGKTPAAFMKNSSYDASIVVFLIMLRYVYAMPVERIIDYMRSSCGFNMRKPTAHKLIASGAKVLENIYKAIGCVIKRQTYTCLDETYHKVLLEKEKPDERGSKKGYIWGALAPLISLIYFWYEDGSRSEDVLLEEFKDYKGFLQSDAYPGYKKLESDEYPEITRIDCLQHIKRKFIECGEDKAAKKIIEIINKLYRKEHKHTVGVKGWTVEKNLEYRQQYAPPILIELRNELESMKPIHDKLPKSALGGAVGYALNEYNAVCDIFKRGDTNLDNNAIERPNRYISLSRRNSLFFGSHEGAKNGCILYTIAVSCKLCNVDLEDYITDVIEKTAGWDKGTSLEKYRDMLPDRWGKN